MMIRIPFPLLGLLNLSGCGGKSGAFNRLYASAVCERMSECAPGVVETAFGTEDECYASDHDRLDRLRSEEGCRFDVDASDTCLEQIYRVSCEGWLEFGEPAACASVYVCSDDDNDAFEYLNDASGE